MWYSSTQNDLGLVFVHDELMLAEVQEKFKVKMEFVSFAYIEGYKLFNYRKSTVVMHQDDSKGKQLNNRVFGSVYLVRNFAINILPIDAYYYCSLGRLGYSTEHDMRCRSLVDAKLFDIDCVDTLISHKYKVHTTISVWVYTGNKRDEWLMRRINTGRHRIVDGIDVFNYKRLLKQRGVADA